MKCKITKLYSKGVQNKKAQLVEVPCFALDIDRGKMGFGISLASSGNKVAFALQNDGTRILPDLEMAELVGWHANGFFLRGVCDELDGKLFRKYYCEWFVALPEEMI